MSFRRLLHTFAITGFVLVVPLSGVLRAERERAASSRAVALPKALSPQSQRGLLWLVQHQLPNGAWGQGEEASTMGQSMEHLKDKGNVADTCMAALALMRAGSTPSSGSHARQLTHALDFVLGEIERSGGDTLQVTEIRGTRVQGKIGPYVDTFMSSMLLAEAKGKMADTKSNQRLEIALAKVLSKIQKNQRTNGTWDDQGWAPVLSQAMAAKGLNRAAQAGAGVDRDVLAKTEGYAHKQFDGKSGGFGGSGNAGIQLYSAAAGTGAMRDAVNTHEMEEGKVREQAEKSQDPKVREDAKERLRGIEESRATQYAAEESLVGRLQDPAFVSGFGSNGGEEFLSYMLVSESLAVKGGDEWKRWDGSMTENLNRVQNGDGSWSGHHCITGRTFVTSAALLVLTADRAPVPLAAKLRRG